VGAGEVTGDSVAGGSAVSSVVPSPTSVVLVVLVVSVVLGVGVVATAISAELFGFSISAEFAIVAGSPCRRGKRKKSGASACWGAHEEGKKKK
jgi:hypothetical protein